MLTCYIISKKLKSSCCDVCCCIFCCKCEILKKRKYEEDEQQAYELPQERDSVRKLNQYGVEEVTDVEIKTKHSKRKGKTSDMVIEQVTGAPNVSPMMAYPGAFPPQAMMMTPNHMMGYPPAMGPPPMMIPPPILGQAPPQMIMQQQTPAGFSPNP